MTILPDLSDLVIEQVSISNDVTVTVRAASPTAPCPSCGTISKRVQSRYTRTLRDLPASGRLVHLIVHVRRFFCQESICVRKIFAERGRGGNSGRGSSAYNQLGGHPGQNRKDLRTGKICGSEQFGYLLRIQWVTAPQYIP